MILEIEKYAKEHGVPIMMKDGMDYLCRFIREHDIKNILEIGTAIGYSAICMASIREDIHVTSIERDEERYQVALQNILNCHLENRSDVILGDALETVITGEYDLIFIDASKGHSIDFFLRYEPYLTLDGVIITDNLSFHGLVEDESLAVTKNQKGLVRKIRNFIEFLDQNENFVTEYVPVGDRISISRRGKRYEKNIGDSE